MESFVAEAHLSCIKSNCSAPYSGSSLLFQALLFKFHGPGYLEATIVETELLLGKEGGC